MSLAVLILIALQLCFVEPGDLAQPVSVGEVSFLADGGSMAIELKGANGKRLFASRQGSLSVESAKQPMAVACYCFGLPYGKDVARGDDRERAVQSMLEAWLAANTTAEDRARFETRSNLEQIPATAYAVLEMLNWIRTRE
ncbi:MAG TPA: hypothetical protein VF555_22350 [Variovorax sp.]